MPLNVHEKAKSSSKKRLFVATSQDDCWTFGAVFEDDASHLRREVKQTRDESYSDPGPKYSAHQCLSARVKEV